MDDVFARYQTALRGGHQLAAEGKFREALARYEEAAQVAGERVLPHIGIGGMQLRLGRPREALAGYDRALALEPGNLDALSGRVAALLAAGRRSEAAEAQEQIAALRDTPRTPAPAAADQSPFTRAETLAMAGEQAHDSGDVQSAISAWLAEAGEHAQEGSYDAALDAALRALALDTGQPRSHLELARIYTRRGWHEKAAEHLALLRRLLDLAPDEDVRASLETLQSELDVLTGGPSAPPAQG